MEAQRFMLAIVRVGDTLTPGVSSASGLGIRCGGRWRATLDVLVAKGLVEPCELPGGGTGWRVRLHVPPTRREAPPCGGAADCRTHGAGDDVLGHRECRR